MAKICMVAYTYYTIDNRVRREANALVEAGHFVEVVSLSEVGRESREIINDVSIVRAPMKKFRGGWFSYIFGYVAFLFWAFLFVTALHFKRGYNIIHVHNMPDFIVFSALIPKVMGVPVILDVHDPMRELFLTIFGKNSRLAMKLIALQEKISYRFADQIITVHEGMRELLMERGGQPNKIEVVHNFPDPKLFSGVKCLPINADNFTIVYAGTVSERHGLEIVLSALKTLENEMPDLVLRIVGDGPDRKRLEGLAVKKGIAEKVIFDGFVPQDQIPAILAGSNVCIAPYSDDPFGAVVFPAKILEAFIVGLPVISSRVPIVMRYMSEEMLFLFELGDVNALVAQIKNVRSNPHLIKEKRRRAKQFTEKMIWQIEKSKLVNLVNTIIAKSSNKTRRKFDVN